MKLFRDRKGVSPVVGVMLMLVVTVILAAAVNAYTNSVSVKKPTPVAQFEAKASYSSGNVTLNMVSGDAIYKSNIAIRIQTSHPLTSGYVNMSNVTFTPNANYVSPGGTILIKFTKEYNKYLNQYEAVFEGPQIHLGVFIGQPFTVTIIDRDTGNPIWTGHLVMNP